MKLVPSLALVSIIAAVSLFILTGINLLSGSFENRTCQTDCVFLYFIGSFVFTITALTLGLFSWFAQGANLFGILSVLLALGLIAVFGVLFIAGNFM